MSFIDPRLLVAQQLKEGPFAEPPLGVPRGEIPVQEVRLLIQFQGDISDLESVGFVTHAVAGDVASGRIQIEQLLNLYSADSIVKIESPYPLYSELHKSRSEIGLGQMHTEVGSLTGNGVVVGIIDTGINFTSSSFRKNDGSSRLLFLWDQSLLPVHSERSPEKYGYGVEYDQSELNRALAGERTLVRHADDDPRAHGTAVAAIAAGRGDAQQSGQEVFAGVAPEADLIFVANSNAMTEPLPGAIYGDTVSVLDALVYIFEKAEALGKTAVVNLSQGVNLGPHDGSSLLEKAIDNLTLEKSGRVIVKSAGNWGFESGAVHATGTVAAGKREQLKYRIPPDVRNTMPDAIEIWYAGTDRLGLSVVSPDGNETDMIYPSDSPFLCIADLPGGNRAFVSSDIHDVNNHDNRLFIQFDRGTEREITEGEWIIQLHGLYVEDGRFDAWIERRQRSVVGEFQAPHRSTAVTVTMPGTARQIITVTSYAVNPDSTSQIAWYSSKGNTRDGRSKPDLGAPGDGIRLSSNDDESRSGTSFAAPLVTGVVALMLEKNNQLTAQQIQEYLIQTARADDATGIVPNASWGHGKLNAAGACERVPSLKHPKNGGADMA